MLLTTLNQNQVFKMVKIKYTDYPESEVIVNYIFDRHRKGLYSLILVTGLPGTGKSSTCQRLGELILEKVDNGIKISTDDIVDSLLELLTRIKNIKQPGEVIIVEELSVLFPSRRAMAKENVAIARVLDTIRKKRVILLSNAPLFNAIDSHVRCMGSVLLETLRINKTQKVVIFKGWKLQTNPGSGKTYRHTFQRDGREVQRFYTAMPNNEVWGKYEEKKDAFMSDLYERLKIEQEKKEKKVNKELDSKKAKEVRGLSPREVEVSYLYYTKNLIVKDIAIKLGVTPNRIQKIIRNIREKMQIPLENKQITSSKVTAGPSS